MIAPALRRPCIAPTARSPTSGLVMGTFGNVSAVDRDRRRGRDQAERRRLRAADARAHGGGLARDRSRGRRHAAPVVRHADAPRALSGVRLSAASSTRIRSTRRCLRRRGMPIRCMGTTHADYFRGDVPVTRSCGEDEVERGLRAEHGRRDRRDVPPVSASRQLDVPAVLVANHGPFTWGADAFEAIAHAEALEFVARLAWRDATARARRRRRPRPACRSSPPAQARPARRTTGRNEPRGPVGSRRNAGGLRGVSLAIVGPRAGVRRGGGDLRSIQVQLRPAERSHPAGLARRGRVRRENRPNRRRQGSSNIDGWRRCTG